MEPGEQETTRGHAEPGIVETRCAVQRAESLKQPRNRLTLIGRQRRDGGLHHSGGSRGTSVDLEPSAAALVINVARRAVWASIRRLLL